MAKDIYKRLAQHLDDMPGGFPATKSGVELRILRRLFTPEEAELAVQLPLVPEDPEVIARRVRLDVDEAVERLEAMAKKGLIYRMVRKGRPTLYMANQFVIGIWEYHVNDLDLELIRDFNEYVPDLFNDKHWKKAPQLRTVPVSRSIDVSLEVLPYENALKLVREQTRFLEAPCICRREHRMTGEGCDKPEGNCLVFGGAVDYYLGNGIGREIDKQEALRLLERADKSGLVLQPSFAKKISNICCCCGCCCQVLQNIKRHPHPADIVSTPFCVSFDPESCNGCGVCVERCQMEALEIHDEKPVLDKTHCIGCGLCVSTCPTHSLTLARKPGPEEPKIPDNLIKAAINRVRVRGKLTPIRLFKFLSRSKRARTIFFKKKFG